MKNKIRRFAELLKENYEMDDQFIKELCTDLSDDFIKFEISKGYFSKSSYKDGVLLFKAPTKKDSRLCYCITVNLAPTDWDSSGNDIDQVRMTLTSPLIHDKKIYKIFGHLNRISDQADDSYLMIRTVSPNHAPYLLIHLYLISDEEVDMANANIREIFYEIKNRFISQKSEFSNNTVVKFSETLNPTIIIETSGDYTDRKLNMILKGLDLSGYKVEKDIKKHPKTGEMFGNRTLNYDSATIYISKK